MITISKTFSFEGAHHLPGLPAGHKCVGMHGHTWWVAVHVSGPIDPVTGMIIDYAKLGEVWDMHVHRHLDHSVLNKTIPNPTTEHIVQWVAERMVDPLQHCGVRLERLVVREGADGGTCEWAR